MPVQLCLMMCQSVFSRLPFQQRSSHTGRHLQLMELLMREMRYLLVITLQQMQEGEMRRYKVRIRYRQPLQDAQLICRADALYILFDEPQRGIAAGQFAAWYDGEVLAGFTQCTSSGNIRNARR